MKTPAEALALALAMTGVLALATAPRPAAAATYLSQATGNWNANGTWPGNVVPKTGTTDSVTIQAGHTVSYTGGGVGLTTAAGGNTNDFGISNGNTITVDGGNLNQAGTSWVRIGNKGVGTLDIKAGGVYLNGPMQVGVETADGAGIINIGDGTGAAGSALLSLATLADGVTATTANVEINLGNVIGASGIITINSDGLLEGDAAGVLRIGRYGYAAGAGTTPQSAVYVQAGGRLNAHGSVEVGANAGALGLLQLSGTGARMVQDDGQFSVGYTGSGTVIIENNAEYSRSNGVKGDLYFGRNAAGSGSLTLRSGGKFIREAGGTVGDFNLGYNGSGTLTIDAGGEFRNNSGNFDWIGARTGSTGTVQINTGGLYNSTASANITVGSEAGATGLLEVNGGSLSMAGGYLHLGPTGQGTFRQISGTTSIANAIMSSRGGTSTLDMRLGTLAISGSFYIGGDVNDLGAGTATATQSGGSVTLGGALVIGMSTGHTGSYTLTGGSFSHTGATADIAVGNRGSGTLTIGAGTTFTTQQTTGQVLVGRENGSSGTLIVNGTLAKAGTGAIRVGHGNTAGVNNTTGAGLLGGTGTITSPGGIIIGTSGTLTGGTTTTVGALRVEGGLTFTSATSSSVQSTLFVNFDSSTALKSDRLTVTGSFSLDSAILSGAWTPGSATGTDTRYWIVINEGSGTILGDGGFANTTLDSTNDWALVYKGMGADGFVTIDGQEFALFYHADFLSGALTGGNDIVLSAMTVPEPSLPLLSLLGLGTLLLRRRRAVWPT